MSYHLKNFTYGHWNTFIDMTARIFFLFPILVLSFIESNKYKYACTYYPRLSNLSTLLSKPFIVPYLGDPQLPWYKKSLKGFGNFRPNVRLLDTISRRHDSYVHSVWPRDHNHLWIKIQRSIKLSFNVVFLIASHCTTEDLQGERVEGKMYKSRKLLSNYPTRRPLQLVQM